MPTANTTGRGHLVHLVTLECKDHKRAQRCLAALENYGKPDALAFQCEPYEFGLKEGTTETGCLLERWNRWEDLDALISKKVVPVLPTYNQLLKRPFDPAKDTCRIKLAVA